MDKAKRIFDVVVDFAHAVSLLYVKIVIVVASLVLIPAYIVAVILRLIGVL